MSYSGKTSDRALKPGKAAAGYLFSIQAARSPFAHRDWRLLERDSSKYRGSKVAQRNRFSLLLLLLVWFGLGGESLAQAVPTAARPIEHVTLGDSTEPLDGPWKFQIGDSPVDPNTGNLLWAEPGFDDSNWESVDVTPKAGSVDPADGWSGYVPGWTGKGHPGHWGYGWYRIRVLVEPSNIDKQHALAVWDVDDAYQVFLNGSLIGSFGKFSGLKKRPVTYWSEPQMFVLPRPEATGGNGSTPAIYTLSFRVWMEPTTLYQNPDGGGIHIAPVLGDPAGVSDSYQSAWLELVRISAPFAVEAILYLLLAIVACSLILFDRSDRAYLWLAGTFLVTSVNAAHTLVVTLTQAESVLTLLLVKDALLTPLALGGWVMVWWVWFQLRRPTWIPKAILVLTVLYGIFNALGQDLFFKLMPHFIGAVFHVASLITRLAFFVLLGLIVFWAIRQRGRDAWLALPAVLLVGFAQFQIELLVLHIPTLWFPFGFGIYVSNLANAALSAVIFVLLLRRLLHSLRRQRQTALDVRQAQEVQHMILPDARTTLPGLLIESEFRPVREVGGDFFQIIPSESDGSLLIVAGDVAGKGLPAGMLVALLVGAIRTAAQFDPDPLVVLKVLNQRLCGRSHAAATCLALRIAADGEATLANAGHLPPYLNGQPMEIEGSLPLGMIEDAEFSVMHFRLSEDDHLLLMSDGIAEATDANGKLFGFEHIHDLLRESASAAALASAAQNFGQEDDISVITITRTAA